MPRPSADMEFTSCGMLTPAVLHCRRIGHAGRRARNIELLKQKTEYLYDMRDSVKQELIKELFLGTSKPMECQKWLNKEREIEDHVNEVLRFSKESSDGPIVSPIKLSHDDLMNTLDEVTYHLEDVPLGYQSEAHAPYRVSKTLKSQRIGGKTYGKGENTKNVNLKRKMAMKHESNIEVQAQAKNAAPKKMPHSKSAQQLDEFGPILGHESVMFRPVLHGPEDQSQHWETETLTSPRIGSNTYEQVKKNESLNQRRKAEKNSESNLKASVQITQASPSLFKSAVQTLTGGSTMGIKDEMTSISCDLEVPSDTFSTGFTESLSNADQACESSIETKTEDEMYSSQTDTLHVYKSEIQHTACETEGGLSAHLAGAGEAIFDGHQNIPSIRETELKTVPSQIEEEDQMRPNFNFIGKQSFKPASPVASFRSSPNSVISVEPVTASFRKEDKISTVNKAETEVSCNTERDQLLPESDLDVGRSIERTVLKILRCMIDITDRKFGVHGIGGIGKTSVLKTLSSYPKTKGRFDLIILVTVSRFWSIRKIQNEVLRLLSLCREDSETDLEVAERLFQVLSGKKFLLLMDDVWEQIDLEAVGIPDPSSENGCKIILASRKLDVLHAMDVVRIFELQTLSRKEAWQLFYEQVGGIIDSLDIQPFAEAIVEGCGGLPLLIIVSGRALSEENNISVWEHASRIFSLPTSGIRHVEGLIQQLKFSFDQLKDHETKSFFLYCCLFAEDQEVNIFEFIESCIQEGIITGNQADAHKRGLDIIDVLVRKSLLQLSEDGDSIKMHDLMRDLAMDILSVGEGSRYLLRAYSRLMEPSIPRGIRVFSSESHQLLLKAGAGLTEPPSEEEWKQSKMIFLMDNKLSTVPERPSCSELLILYLQRNYQLRVIPMSFFDSMTCLKVLNLSKTRIKSLPKSLSKLQNLQILILRDCERLVALPPEIGSLECLEVLDLRGTQISRLPDEIGKLVSLRHLEVSLYGSINYWDHVKLRHGLISGGIISSLCSLETLSIVVYPGDQRWHEDVKSVMLDLGNLTELRSLCFHFPESEHLELFFQKSIAWNAQRLTKFKFVVGHDVKSITSRVPDYVEFDYSQQSRSLRFVNGENIPEAVLRALACSTAFYLDHHLNIRSLTNLGLTNINGLNFCVISECPKIETVVESRELTATVFPSLEILSINHLWSLTHIWQGNFPKGSFAGLRILSVHACPKVKYIFCSSMVQLVSELEELEVEDCPAIEEIIHEDEIIDSGCNTLVLPGLKKLTLHYLPGLVNIWTSAGPSLEHISFYDCPNLKTIGKDSMSKRTIKEIKAEESWWDSLEWENTELQLHLKDRFIPICEDDL